MKKSNSLWLITALLILVNLIVYLTQWGGDTVLLYVSDLLPVACSLIAIICLIIAYRSFTTFDKTKLAWLLILIGQTFFFLGESLYGYLEIALKTDMNATFPSIADIFWCAGYLPLIAGLATLFISYKRSGFPMGNLLLYNILSIVILVVASGVIYYLLIPVFNDTETTALAKVFYFLYPVSDLFLVIPALFLMYITSLFGQGIISRPLRMLAIGFLCVTVADLLYSVLSWQDLYGNGNLIDLAWHFGYLAIGLAALYQKELIDSFK
jgi:hypothetical protein